MKDLFLIARVAHETVALPAAEIGSVVEVDEIAAVPRVAPHITGLFALRSRVLTVVDTRVALGEAPTACHGPATAVIAHCEGHDYALLVDAVEDVVEAPPPEPCPAVLAPGWRRAARGVVRHGDAARLLLDPATLVAGPEALVA